jgi:hypothetical protein
MSRPDPRKAMGMLVVIFAHSLLFVARSPRLNWDPEAANRYRATRRAWPAQTLKEARAQQLGDASPGAPPVPVES